MLDLAEVDALAAGERVVAADKQQQRLGEQKLGRQLGIAVVKERQGEVGAAGLQQRLDGVALGQVLNGAERGVAASGFPPLCNIPHCCLP